MAIDPISAGIQIVGSLFKSKKHYTLFYFEKADNTWKFVMNDHPSNIKPIQQNYAAAGIPTKVVRDAKGTALPPTDIPAGYTASKLPSSSNTLMIVAVVAVIAVILFLVIRKRK